MDKWEKVYVHGVPIGIGIKISQRTHKMFCNTIIRNNQHKTRDLEKAEKFISKVVHQNNTYQELVEALEEILEEFPPEPKLPLSHNIIAIVTKALKKAKS